MSGFKNITEIKKANKAAGHYWFSVKDSKVVSKVIGGRYWVESNAPYHEGEPRRIQAAGVSDTGEVSWLNYAKPFESIEAAKAYIKAIVDSREA